MKRFSAQYIITNSGIPLKRGIITTDDDGTIISIDDTKGSLKEKQSIEFYNGIIIPGFVNCHCHLELSHLKGSIARGEGLNVFIEQIRSIRDNNAEIIRKSASYADNDMFNEGVSLCADTCNTSLSFDIKKESRIEYINLLEVFGIDPEKADQRLDSILKVAETAADMNLPFSIIPHALYSMSLPLLRILREKSENNKITSIHFMETSAEENFLKDQTGPFLISYERSSLMPLNPKMVNSHADAVLNEITLNGNLILVHNTFINRETIRKIKDRNNIFWCLCPGSNIYIENKLPPLDLLLEEGCEIVIGTDSLASNNKLSILEELKILQQYFTFLSVEELVKWGTINGAKALGEDDHFGKIGVGKTPGLLLLENVDLQNMKLLPESSVKRLI
jgi:cytosine/adenosine deaminase-related metal-dependent hydrolase